MKCNRKRYNYNNMGKIPSMFARGFHLRSVVDRCGWLFTFADLRYLFSLLASGIFTKILGEKKKGSHLAEFYRCYFIRILLLPVNFASVVYGDERLRCSSTRCLTQKKNCDTIDEVSYYYPR